MGEKESRLCDTYFLFYYTHYAVRGNSGNGIYCGAFCVRIYSSANVTTWYYGAALYYEYTLYYSWS